MKDLNLRNITMMALVASCLMQIGAQLYALSVVASTISLAPPRSFAILQGEYRYDSSAFWSTVPAITSVLFLIALVANWKTPRRKLLLLALTLFIIGGLVAGLYVEPVFDEMKAIGFRDEVDPALQRRAAVWYSLDWAVCSIGHLPAWLSCWHSYARLRRRPLRIPIRDLVYNRGVYGSSEVR